MVTIEVLGLDQYVVGHYSKDCTADIANILETSEDEINFYSPCDSLLFHDGVEQTSWNTLVVVRIPKKYELFESKLADYLLETLRDFSINVEINFEYIAEGKTYSFVNSDYPRFLTENNIANSDTEDDDCSCGHDHEHHEEEEDDEALDYNNPDEIYLGDVFKEHQKEMDELDKKLKNN